jgi:release factor glutamine methyltransferase
LGRPGDDLGRTPEGEGLRKATALLTAVSDTPRLDAEILRAHALGIAREELHFGIHGIPDSFDILVARRLAHEPIAYITGNRDFWTVSLHVAPGVLIPRPDSETLIDAAVAHFGKAGPKRVLDLGTGSGALLLAALDEWPGATGVGVDASEAALTIARINAAAIAPGRADIREGGWTGTGEAFDLILCNPPYIATDEVLPPDVADWEPASALFAGDDGLDDYRLIAQVLAPQLAPGGIACIEIGHTQRAAVTALFERQGFAVDCRADLAGRDRCLIVKNK